MNLKRTFLLVNACLTGLVLWMAFTIIQTWISTGYIKTQSSVRGSEPRGPAKISVEKSEGQGDYRIVIDHDIFGTTKTSTKGPLKQEESVKLTDLNLKLKGTVVGEGRDLYAIIWDGSTNKENLYYPNDFIQGARIVRVLIDRVILEIDGTEESLMIAEEIRPRPVTPRSRPAIQSRKGRRPRI